MRTQALIGMEIDLRCFSKRIETFSVRLSHTV